MQAVTVDPSSLPPGLREKFECFETDVAAYVGAQKNLVALDEGNQALRQKAATLSAAAVNADNACKRMAGLPNADQDEINAEITRIAGMRREAQELLTSAESRLAFRGAYLVQLAQARFSLVKTPDQINEEYYAHRLAQLLERPDASATVLEALSLSRVLATYSQNRSDAVSCYRHDASERADVIKRNTLVTLTAGLVAPGEGAKNSRVSPLAELPGPVPGELVVRSPVELTKLKREYS